MALGYQPIRGNIDVEVACAEEIDWWVEIRHYLLDSSQPASRKLKYKALKYVLLDDNLYYQTL